MEPRANNRTANPSGLAGRWGLTGLVVVWCLAGAIPSVRANGSPVVELRGEHADCSGKIVDLLGQELTARTSHPIRESADRPDMTGRETLRGWVVRLRSTDRGECRVTVQPGENGKATSVDTMASSEPVVLGSVATRVAWVIDASNPGRLQVRSAEGTSRDQPTEHGGAGSGSSSPSDSNTSGGWLHVATLAGASLSPSSGRTKGLVSLHAGTELGAGVVVAGVARLPVGQYVDESIPVERLDSVRWRVWSTGLRGGFRWKLGRGWTVTPAVGVRRTWMSLTMDVDSRAPEESEDEPEDEDDSDSATSTPPSVRSPDELAHWSAIGTLGVSKRVAPGIAVQMSAEAGVAGATREWAIEETPIGNLGRFVLDLSGGVRWSF